LCIRDRRRTMTPTFPIIGGSSGLPAGLCHYFPEVVAMEGGAAT
jgi:hypothetical protein